MFPGKAEPHSNHHGPEWNKDLSKRAFTLCLVLFKLGRAQTEAQTGTVSVLASPESPVCSV